MTREPPFCIHGSSRTLTDVKALQVRYDRIPGRPNLTGLDLDERFDAVLAHRTALEDLANDVARLDEALASDGAHREDERRCAAEALRRTLEEAVGWAQQRQWAAENACAAEAIADGDHYVLSVSPLYPDSPRHEGARPVSSCRGRDAGRPRARAKRSAKRSATSRADAASGGDPPPPGATQVAVGGAEAGR